MQPQIDHNLTFQQIDIGKFVVRFADNVDINTPDLIAWELKQKAYQNSVLFVDTRKKTELNGDRIEMEIHVKATTTDVADLIRSAAAKSSAGWDNFESNFVRAIQ